MDCENVAQRPNSLLYMLNIFKISCLVNERVWYVTHHLRVRLVVEHVKHMHLGFGQMLAADAVSKQRAKPDRPANPNVWYKPEVCNYQDSNESLPISFQLNIVPWGK